MNTQESAYNVGSSIPILVRKGGGSYCYESTEFTDTVDHVRRVPREHVGWRSIRYKNERYRLGGGVRTPYYICLNNPIRSSRDNSFVCPKCSSRW